MLADALGEPSRVTVTRTTNIIGDPKLTFATDLAAGAGPGHVLVLASDLIDIALATGTKTAVSGAGRGAGTLFNFREQLAWFQVGRFPCGWDGDWPNGRMRVY